MNTLILTYLLMAGGVKFDTVASLQAVPDTGDFFMEEPLSYDFDNMGNYYLLDGGAKVIFSWDKQGRYLGTIGKPGPGPGEFVLSGHGPATGYINVIGEKLYAMDPRKNEIMIFGEDGVFERAISLRMSRGRLLDFAVTDEGNFLLHQRSRKEDKFYREITQWSPAGEKTKTYHSQADDSFNMSRTAGHRSIHLKAYNPVLVSQFNRANNELLVGDSGTASFAVISKDGGSRTLRIASIREEVSKADKEEYQAGLQTRRFRPTVTYPEKKPYYTHLVSLGKQGFLVYQQSVFYRNIEGVHLDEKGVSKGRFSMMCGEQGGLMASRNRLLCISLNEDDDFELKEIQIHGKPAEAAGQ